MPGDAQPPTTPPRLPDRVLVPHGFAQERVNLREVKDLAARVEAAAQTSLDLLIAEGEFRY